MIKILSDFKRKQAGADLCQAQVKIGVIVYIGGKVEVEIVVEILNSAISPGNSKPNSS